MSAVTVPATPPSPGGHHDEHTIYQFHDIVKADGSTLDLASFRGRPVLIVNTATHCGFTPQLKELEVLYHRFGASGGGDLEILAFPCNQFLFQEPGSDKEIVECYTSKYSVTYPIMSKIKVNGKKAIPLYKWLTSEMGGRIKWNFTKFLIGRDGKVVARWEPSTKPEEMVDTMEKYMHEMRSSRLGASSGIGATTVTP